MKRGGVWGEKGELGEQGYEKKNNERRERIPPPTPPAVLNSLSLPKLHTARSSYSKILGVTTACLFSLFNATIPDIHRPLPPIAL